jgi:hypothetical protein
MRSHTTDPSDIMILRPIPFSRAFCLAPAVLAASLLVAGCGTRAPEAVAQTPAPERAEPAPAPAAPVAPATDPRVGLAAGVFDAGQAISNLALLASIPRPDGFHHPDPGADFSFANTDLAFTGDHLIMGNYNGFLIYDISGPGEPVLRTAFVCPGGQGDVSIHGDLLFVSVEETRARIDCGTQGTSGAVDPDRFRGVRIFDISDLDAPRQVAAVQTCRGSHTHTLVTDPRDDAHAYIYNSGTGGVRPDAELPGCADIRSPDDPATSYWQIEVIRVPLAAPAEARIVNEPRIFEDDTGEIAGLWPGGAHGPGTQFSAQTNACHDITAYPEIGLAAGACSGNGILLDISDPANPVRIDAVVDENFAYWHSATFNNDGSKVIFTDEWGGGGAPRCRAEDPKEWGANAIFDRVDGRLHFRSYYKLPAPQTATENCVAHNGSLIPVPGRDIKVQAWYQGGISVFDFTDSADPVEIAFFDRGPLSARQLVLGGYWSAYWLNGRIYGSEITRGLDVFELVPSEHLSRNEIEAAKLVRFDEFNPQHQPMLTWPASFVVARAYLDQLVRGGAIPPHVSERVAAELDGAEQRENEELRRGSLEELELMSVQLEADAQLAAAGGAELDAERLSALAETIRDLVNTQR